MMLIDQHVGLDGSSHQAVTAAAAGPRNLPLLVFRNHRGAWRGEVKVVKTPDQLDEVTKTWDEKATS